MVSNVQNKRRTGEGEGAAGGKEGCWPVRGKGVNQQRCLSTGIKGVGKGNQARWGRNEPNQPGGKASAAVGNQLQALWKG